MLLHKKPPTELVTLFEYEAIDILDPYEMDCLERISKMTGVEIFKPVIKQRQTQLQARQYVGVVTLGKRTIQILPKIYYSCDREKNQQEATRNLLVMLEYAGYCKIRAVDLAALERMENWFEVLTYLFASHLQREWRLNPHRNYESIEAVLPVLKGKWEIAKQLKRPEIKHLFAVTYDEFTLDNPLNRIFRYVVEKLWQITRNSGNRQALTELRNWMDEVKLLPVVTANMAKQVQLSRLNQQYEPLLNLAQLFLQNLSIQLSAGGTSAFSFMFDMNQVFERFIIGFIQKHRNEILPSGLSKCDLLSQSQGVVKYLANYTKEGKEEKVFRLKPDLVFCDRDRDIFPLILDMKYKSLNEEKRNLGISESDFYQMYAYANRYDCSKVILIYPQTLELSDSHNVCFGIEGTKKEICAVTVNLFKDLSQPEARKSLEAELKKILETANESSR